jgi:hypothetical protein
MYDEIEVRAAELAKQDYEVRLMRMPVREADREIE